MQPVTKSVLSSLSIACLIRLILNVKFRRLIWRMFLLFIIHLTALSIAHVIHCRILGWILHIKVTFVQWLVACQQDSQVSCSVRHAEDYVATTGTVNPHRGQLYVVSRRRKCAGCVHTRMCPYKTHPWCSFKRQGVKWGFTTWPWKFILKCGRNLRTSFRNLCNKLKHALYLQHGLSKNHLFVPLLKWFLWKDMDSENS